MHWFQTERGTTEQHLYATVNKKSHRDVKTNKKQNGDEKKKF